MAQVLRSLPLPDDPHFLNREDRFADAAVYRLTEELALVQSVDFFTPVVDDPHLFGQIAAANSLSDIYALGGRPLTALNIVCFPCAGGSPELQEALEFILRGGYDKVREAGAMVVGGHSVEDKEPKYGLAVTGLIDPRRMLTPAGARPGDRLYLTKPLGAGIITTALKGEAVSPEEVKEALESMARLNAAAAKAALSAGATACTDVTGFGLLGHLRELLLSSGAAARLGDGNIPLYPGTKELAAQGFIPAGAYRNLEYYRAHVEWAGSGQEEDSLLLMADPQTSGGLLIAVERGKGELMEKRLAEEGVKGWLVGTIVEGPAGLIRVEESLG